MFNQKFRMVAKKIQLVSIKQMPGETGLVSGQSKMVMVMQNASIAIVTSFPSLKEKNAFDQHSILHYQNPQVLGLAINLSFPCYPNHFLLCPGWRQAHALNSCGLYHITSLFADFSIKLLCFHENNSVLNPILNLQISFLMHPFSSLFLIFKLNLSPHKWRERVMYDHMLDCLLVRVGHC